MISVKEIDGALARVDDIRTHTRPPYGLLDAFSLPRGLWMYALRMIVPQLEERSRLRRASQQEALAVAWVDGLTIGLAIRDREREQDPA